jgi:hypothetical protein
VGKVPDAIPPSVGEVKAVVPAAQTIPVAPARHSLRDST